MHSTFAVKVCPSDWRIENLVHRLSLQLSGLFHSDLHAHVVYSPPLLTSPRSRVKVKAVLLETSLYPPIPLAPVYISHLPFFFNTDLYTSFSFPLKLNTFPSLFLGNVLSWITQSHDIMSSLTFLLFFFFFFSPEVLLFPIIPRYIETYISQVVWHTTAHRNTISN